VTSRHKVRLTTWVRQFARENRKIKGRLSFDCVRDAHLTVVDNIDREKICVRTVEVVRVYFLRTVRAKLQFASRRGRRVVNTIDTV